MPLEELGLSKLEALTYLSALDLGQGNISELAENAGIERTAIYYHIDRLLEMGLLQSVESGKRTLYLPADPQVLKDLLKHKTDQLSAIFPKIDHQYSIATSRSITEYYHGRDEVTKYYDRMYELLAKLSPPDNVIYVLGVSYHKVSTQHEVFMHYKRPNHQIDIVTKCILPRSQKSPDPAENLKDPYIIERFNMPAAELKYISDKYAYPAPLVIINDIVCLIDFSKYYFSIIENANIATTWRMFFDFIWANLKET